MRAVTEVVKTFEMPGPRSRASPASRCRSRCAGIYDLRIHLDDVLTPVLRQWGVLDIEGLDADGEKAREELAEFLARIETSASRFVERREARRARQAAGA